MKAFREHIRRMTDQEARFVRVLRVDLGCSWGRVAELYPRVFPVYPTDRKPTQEWGAELCAMAAETMGEAPGEEPWN